jgi:hypothetical protein
VLLSWASFVAALTAVAGTMSPRPTVVIVIAEKYIASMMTSVELCCNRKSS